MGRGVAGSRPAPSLSSVDFPLPDAPITAVNSPAAMCSVTSSSATVRAPPVKTLLTLVMSISESMSLLPHLVDDRVEEFQFRLGVQLAAFEQQGHLRSPAFASDLFLVCQVAHPLQVHPPLPVEQSRQMAIGLTTKEQEPHVKVLAKKLWLRVWIFQPFVQPRDPGDGRAVGLAAAVAAVAGRLDEPVALQTLEHLVDRSDVDLPSATEHLLKSCLDLVPVQGLFCQ